MTEHSPFPTIGNPLGASKDVLEPDSDQELIQADHVTRDGTAGVFTAPRRHRYDHDADPVLSVRDLHVSFNSENGTVHAVRGVNFDLRPGEVLGIVGESGSGKSVTSMAIMGLLAPTATVRGEVRFQDQNLVTLSDKQMCAYRGSELSMVFQDPLSSLTPVYTIGRQLDDAIRIHNPSWSKARRRERAVELLTKVGIPSPEDRLKAYPHQFSGGMRQRVLIAIAMANEPSVLICDEPTTALDVTIQAQILEVLRQANELTGCAVIMITHDLGVIAGFADNVLVMYGGRPVEYAETHELFATPRMPYTIGLIRSVPRVDRYANGPLATIDGQPPNLLTEPTGCTFAPRCPLATEACTDGEPDLREVSDRHLAACVRSDELVSGAVDTTELFAADTTEHEQIDRAEREQRTTVLSVEDVKKHFPLTEGALVKRRIGTVRAVDGVSFDIREGECLALVGESGSGKTTTLLEIMEMNRQQPGRITINGASNKRSDDGSGEKFTREVRKTVQMVFQDPLSSLDPRFTVFEVISEPLEIMGWDHKRVRERVFELLRLVGLQPDHANRFPVQFSGGQRQRIAIARALAINPKLIVLDEPVSALDVSIQAGVLNMLDDLRNRLGLSYMLVAHDLSVVRHIADRVAVMHLGKIVEYGQVDKIFDAPSHPYTKALISAIPVPDPVVEERRQRIILSGDLPSPLQTPSGCSFSSRCPLYAQLPEEARARCREAEPPLVEVADDHSSACLFPSESLVAHSPLEERTL
ncbi:ABC transporter ATP-binding protein [Brachybacterium sp. Marseille-Q7125]|uniref:dipeptide ABC transporter ATP-binding protein n=1 Tax=Brachybacterium sp. Marseille-Q7125 TaxID=2932815 RepID=UPI001FF3820F|nr:ABC transporter ATP-binding protein [Brachybacterium sp. Marseille-Q7125]